MVCVIAVWATLAWKLLNDNMEVLESVSTWRAAVATVLLTICAPVFFLSDVAEFLLDLILGEE